MPASAPSFAKSRPWAWYLAVTLAATGLSVLLPANSPASTAILLAVNASVIGALVWGLRRYRPDPRAPWLVLLAGYALQLVANAARCGRAPSGPLATDVISSGLYFAAYLGIAIGLVLLVRARGALRDFKSLADAFIAVIGLGIVWFEFVVAPFLERPGVTLSERLVTITYPVPDLVFLILLLWILFSKGPRGAAMLLLLGGIAVQAAADGLLGLSDAGLASTGGVQQPLWLLSLALVGAAALHPRMALIGARSDESSWLPVRRRVYLLAAVSLLVPLSLLRESLRTGTGGDFVLSVATAGFVLLVYGRLRGLTVDVETYARIQAQLTAAEARFRRLVEQVPAVIYIDSTDQAAASRYVSPRYAELTGYSPEETVTQPMLWWNRIHPDDRDRVMAAARRANERDEPITLEYRIIARDGGERWVRDEAVIAEYNAEGRPCAWQGVVVDITETHRAEQSLREQAQTLRRAQRIARLASWELDAATGQVTMSDTAYAFVGREPGDGRSTGLALLELALPEDREELRGAVLAASREPRHLSTEFRVRDLDGNVRHVELQAEPRLDDAGAFSGLVGTVQDVTDRALAAEHLRLSEHNLAEAQRIAHIGSWEWNLETDTALRSEELHRIYGVEPGAIPGTKEASLTFVHPDDLARVQASARAAASGSARHDLNYRIIRADGVVRVVHEAGEVIRDEHGGPVRMLGTVEDITERVRAEEEIRRLNAELEQRIVERTAELAAANEHLREANTYLENLVSSMPAMLFRGHGPTLRADYISPAVEKILGFTPAEVIARPRFWMERVHADDRRRVIAEVRDVIKRQLPLHRLEQRMVRRDGRVRWVYAVIRYEFDADGAWHFTGTALDITEEKRAEDDLRAAKEEAERANRAKSEFLSSMSHELRTPLNSVLGFGQLLERSALLPDDRDSVVQILRAGRALLVMIDSVLELARVEAGQLTLSIEPVSVLELISETVDLVRPVATGRGIRLVTPTDVERPPWVLADRIRLKQVLLNLLRNAVTFNRDDGSVTIACEVAAGDRLRVSVTDTGLGIPAERQATLFTILDRRIGSDRMAAGLGVGLALSAHLIEAMNGSISVESELGAGSTFAIELPLAAEPAVGYEGRSEPGTGAPPWATVVYVEDNLANLKLVERILDLRPRTRVLAAMQGSLGLDLARQQHPDLVLLDLHLPDMHGDEVLRLLKDDPATRDIPVIVLSSALGNDTGQRFIALGAVAYLAKPIDMAAFLAAVDRVLGGRAAHA
jgi:PAS domain S-box-containing protein